MTKEKFEPTPEEWEQWVKYLYPYKGTTQHRLLLMVQSRDKEIDKLTQMLLTIEDECNLACCLKCNTFHQKTYKCHNCHYD